MVADVVQGNGVGDGKVAERAKEEERLRARLEELLAVGVGVGDLDQQLAMAGTWADLAELLIDGEKHREAEAAWRKAVACLEPLEAKESRADVLEAYGAALTELGDLLLDRDAFREAERCYRRGVDVTAKLASLDPGIDVQYDLASLYIGLGDALDELNASEEAAECWETALSMAGRLTGWWRRRNSIGIYWLSVCTE